MIQGKKSFLERLTGSVNLDEYNNDIFEEDHRKSGHAIDNAINNNEATNERDSSWMEEESSEGQLTVDVYQTPEEIVIRALVAGVRPDQLDVSITRDMVTIKGKREESKEASDDNYFYRELYWGGFSRTILLPQEVDVELSEANQKHGLLTIKMPKIDKEKQTKLKVKG